MSESLPGDRLPTLHGPAADQTPSMDHPSGPFDKLPTLGPEVPAAPDAVPVIAGYEIVREIGRGGMGVVYEARQLRPRRLVALKVLRAGAGSADDRARFDREADVLARLSCPGVVQVYGAGAYADRDGAERPYVALELVAGTSLDRVLRGGVLAPAEAAALLLPLARTMQTVHASGVVHRDLKPANVLLSSPSPPPPPLPRGERGSKNLLPPLPSVGEGGRGGEGVKITDFGLAHLLEPDDAALTRAGQVLGTPSYAAPEQVESRHGPIGPACDVHALGAILYECLTGRPPFKGASLAETLDQVARLEPVPVRRLRPDVPRDLETICHKCLRKEPHRRYASAAELADDLERFAQGRPIAARPVSLAESAWRGARRRPLTSGLVALVALLLLLGAALGAWLPAHLEALHRANELAAAEAEQQRLVAVSNEYLTLLLEAGRDDREPGWPSRTLDKVSRANDLATPLRDPAALRGHAARCLGATEFVTHPAVRLRFAASRIAAHPSRPLLAVAQFKAWPKTPCHVLLLELPSGRIARRLHFVPTAVGFTDEGRAAQDTVSALAFSPDGRWLVAGTRTGALVRWDLDQAEPEAVAWAGHDGTVRHVCLDGAALFSTADGVLRRWSAGGCWALTHQSKASGQPALASGDLLLTDGENVHRLAPADLSPRRPPVATAAALIAVPPAPAPAFVARGPSLWAFDAAVGRKYLHLRRQGSAAHDGAITDLAASPDGELVASVSDNEGRVRVWDAASAEMVCELPRVDDLARVTFDATGRWLAVLNGSEVRLWEVRRSQVQARAALQTQKIQAACWTGRDDELAVVAGDRWAGGGELSVWAAGARSPRVRRAVRLPEVRLPALLAAGGGRLAWADAGGVALGRAADLAPLSRVEARSVHGLAHDGERLWVAYGREVRRWRGEPLVAGPAWDNDVAEVVGGVPSLWCVAAGRRTAVVGGKDGVVRVLGAERADLRASEHASTAPVCAVSLDAAEEWALVGLADGAVKLLRLGVAAADVSPPHRDRVTAVGFLPGGRAVTASMDGTVRLWQVRDGRMSLRLTLSLGAAVLGVSASEDGERLAVVLADERAARVWHLGRLRRRLAEMRLE